MHLKSLVQQYLKLLFRRDFSCFLILLFFQVINGNTIAQTTIIIKEFPSIGTNQKIFLAGNFNNWNPGDTNYIFKPSKIGKLALTLKIKNKTAEAKVTLGSWNSVETDSMGNDIPNRIFRLNADTIFITVKRWKKETETLCISTALPQVKVLNDSIYIPGFHKKRTIRIYLPPDYYNCEKKYPVLYMHDGQNLFDKCTSFAGEWETDETMNKLYDKGKTVPIVVGIDNGGEERLFEYSPWISPEHGGGGGEIYVSFLVKELKPFIDSHFRTLPDRKNTMTGGSSMGAFISVYAALQYPETFSKVLSFSPAFAFSDSIFIWMKNIQISEKIRFYLIAGTTEHKTMVPNMKKAVKMLQKAGITHTDIYMKTFPDRAHAEWFWAREFEKAYQWLVLEE